MHGRNTTFVILAVLIPVLVGGCASNVGTSIPSWAGGEPESLPAPTGQSGSYPLIGAVPPPRPTKPVTEDEQKRMQSELTALRKRVDTERQSAEKSDSGQKTH